METLASIIESILFVSGKEVAVKDIAEKLEVTNKEIINTAKKLQEKYSEESGIHLLIFNNKLQFCSNPNNAEPVATVLNPIKERELSRSMLEVAAIVAYKQPVTRLDIEDIRGVNSEYAVQNLLRMKVIDIVGRKDSIGKPALLGTTDNFLKRFQISSLDELPDYEFLMSQIKDIHGTASSYLFKKDEYDPDKDPDNQQSYETLSSNVETNEENNIAENVEDSDFTKSIENEEIPDYLKDEEFEIIT